MYVLNDIAIKLDLDQMILDFKLAGRQRLIDEFLEMAREAENLARPKALYHLLHIEERGENHVIIDGERLDSRVLRINLEQTDTAFAGLATCGRELDSWAASKSNILHQFWAKTITDSAMSAAIVEMEACLKNQNRIETVSLMTPGSIDDWPISQQSQLFKFFGEHAAQIGVELTDSFLMTPLSTVSCLVFKSDSRFFSCQLCPQADCHSRRADYDEHMLSERYAISADNTGGAIPSCDA